ncbi:MAG TPA: FliM/FliN family flagellar motor switch protein [Rhabdochlamydiaceae bacterium]|jgi:type III secretion system YscQ/HrcQ family protein|nr:FliM/FliN family flagellar motor switch protein [Rhabdochlamydiaceae bacterium]
MKEVSHDWLKLVEKALEKTEQLPSLEENFPFPWADASHAIGVGLKLDLTLSSKSAGWKKHEESLQGLGEKVYIVSVEMAPIQGVVFFAMSENDVARLTAHSLLSLLSEEHKEGISNAKLREGFYHFLFLKALEAIDHLKIFKDVSFHFSTHLPVPMEDAFCIDVDCALSEKTLHGRLICPQSFLNAFKTFQPMQKETLLSSTEHIDLSLRCEVGHTTLSQEEWDTLRVGDFVILDRCSYDPVHQKGSATLMLGSTPLLIVRMKSEGMKVLDFALYREESSEASADLRLTAELGSLSMPLSKLLHLEPGSMIDLDLSPEQGVDLTLSGKKIAKGGLLKLGEIVGFRILDLAK